MVYTRTTPPGALVDMGDAVAVGSIILVEGGVGVFVEGVWFAVSVGGGYDGCGRRRLGA